MRASVGITKAVAVGLLLCSCSGGQSAGDAPTRQVTTAVACTDAEAYLPTAVAIVASGQEGWDAARQKGQALLAEEAPDPEVTAALHDLGSAGIALADATQELAADPAAKARLAAKDMTVLESIKEQIDALNTAGDRVSDTC